MQKLDLWHNISCSKSNSAKDFLDQNGFEISVRDYLANPPSKVEIEDLLTKLNISIFDLVRTGEEIYKELKLESIKNEEKLIEIGVVISFPITISILLLTISPAKTFFPTCSLNIFSVIVWPIFLS